MKHKHYDCIVALAEGKPVEFSVDGNKWILFNKDQHYSPFENTLYSWRIKKEPVIEVKYFICSYGEYKETLSKIAYDLKITYQDGKAIKAEVAE